MVKTAFQVIAEIKKIESRADNAWRMIVDTNELSPEEAGKLTQYKSAQGWMLFKPGKRGFKEEEVVLLPEIELESGEKPKSQRLRAALFRLWESTGGKGRKDKKSSEEHYNESMEKIIDQVKERI